MSHSPKFESYSLAELFESLSSIDKERFPDRVKVIKSEIAKRQGNIYSCQKCNNKSYEIGEARISGSAVQAIFELEMNQFVSVSCLECGYTEFYKGNSSGITALIDLMVG